MENLALAVEKGKETGFRYRLVTLDGETVNPGGSLTGGSTKATSSSILGRKRNMEELQQKINDLDESLLAGRQKEAELEEAVQDARRQWEEVKERIQGLRLREVEVSSVLDRWQADKGRQETEAGNLQAQITEVSLEKESILQNVEHSEKNNWPKSKQHTQLEELIHLHQQEN